MADDKIMLTLEKIERRLKEIKAVVSELEQAIADYLQWMAANGYSKGTQKEYALVLKRFSVFIKHRKCNFQAIFT